MLGLRFPILSHIPQINPCPGQLVVYHQTGKRFFMSDRLAHATASWPSCVSLLTTFEPMSPIPPITTIFMISPFVDFSQFGLRPDRAANVGF